MDTIREHNNTIERLEAIAHIVNLCKSKALTEEYRKRKVKEYCDMGYITENEAADMISEYM